MELSEGDPGVTPLRGRGHRVKWSFSHGSEHFSPFIFKGNLAFEVTNLQKILLVTVVSSPGPDVCRVIRSVPSSPVGTSFSSLPLGRGQLALGCSACVTLSASALTIALHASLDKDDKVP